MTNGLSPGRFVSEKGVQSVAHQVRPKEKEEIPKGASSQ